MRSRLHSVAILLLLIVAVSGEIYVWNNDTSGNFHDTRWLLNGNPANPLYCCPGINDSAAIVSSSAIAPTVTVRAPIELMGLQVGPSSQSYLSFTFNPSSKNATFRDVFYINSGSLVTIDGVDLFFPSGQNSYFYPGTYSVFSATDFSCIVPGNCTLIFNRAGLFGQDVFSRVRFDSIDLLFYYLPLQLELNNYAFYQIFNSTANFVVTSIVANQGWAEFFQSTTVFQYSKFVLGADNSLGQLAYFAWWDNSYALIRNSRLEGTGGEFGVRSGSTVEMDDSGDNSRLFIINLSKCAFTAEDRSTLVLTNYPMVNLTDRTAFLIRDNSTLRISNSTLSLVQAAMQLWNGSFAFLENTTINFNSNCHFQIGKSFMNDKRGSALRFDPSSRLSIDSSQLLVDSLTISNQTEIQNSQIHLRSDLITNPSSTISIINSTLLIEGYANLSAQNSLKNFNSNLKIDGSVNLGDQNEIHISFGSELAISGTWSAANSRVRLFDSNFMLYGGFRTSNCSSNWTLVSEDFIAYLTTHASCVTWFSGCQVLSNGSMDFASYSSVVFTGSDVSLRGSLEMGPQSLAFITDADMVVSGNVSFGEMAFAEVENSTFEFQSGTFLLETGVELHFRVNSNVSLTGASLHFLALAKMFTTDSAFNISGGDLVIDGLDISPEDGIIGGINAKHSLIFVSGGQILARKFAAILVSVSSRLELHGGSIKMEQSGFMQLDDRASMLVDGGNILLNRGEMYLFKSRGLVRRGDIRLSNDSGLLVTDRSDLVVEGSVYLDGFSVLTVINNSTLTILGGSIVIMDAKSFVGVSSGGAIYGVGSISGRMSIFDGGIISAANSSSTELTLGSLIQYNGSTFQTTLSSSYVNGSSTVLHVTKNTTIGGGIRVTVDPSMEQRLKNGERIVLITSDVDISGAFESTLIDGSEEMRCGIRVDTAQRTVSVIFELSLCNSAPGAPGSGAFDSAGSAVPGIVAGVVVGLLIIIIIVVVVLAIKVKAFRKAIMPWRDRTKNNSKQATSTEMADAPPSPSSSAPRNGPASSWTRAVAPAAPGV